MLVLAVLAFGGTRVLATYDSMNSFNFLYNTLDTPLDTCTVCHPNWTPFSTDIKNDLNSYAADFADPAIGDNTFNQLLEDKDSDGDGATNIEEILALTFPGDNTDTPPTGPGPTLISLTIDGPMFLNEGSSAAYTATASWSNDTTSIVGAVWSVSLDTAATIDSSSGQLTALEVDSDREVIVSATFDGTTANATVTIVNVPAASITWMPEDGTVDVPVTTVVVATLTGPGDIATLVHDGTFSLSVDGSAGTVAGSIDYNDSHTEATFTPLEKLAYLTTYTAQITSAAGGLPPALASSAGTTFRTIAQCIDTDGDGVGDCEDDYPNDHGKATPPSVRGSGKFLVDACGNAGIGLAQCEILTLAEGISDMFPQFKRQGKPFGFSFPDGLVQFTLRGVNPGETATVTVTFPSGVPKGSKIYRVDGNGFREWTGAVVNGNKVTMHLTDGGPEDADGTLNGEIVDPIGLAVPTNAVMPQDGTSDVSAGGGCSVAGSHEEWKEAFGSFGFIALVWLGLALRRRKRRVGS